MGVFEEESSTFQDRDYRQHLNRNWNNGNKKLEAQDKRMAEMGKTDYPGSNEVTQARVGVDGTVHSTINGRIDSIELDSIDSKNMIKALKSGAPKGVYSDLSALQDALPNGADGIYITSDNNHWHYWSNGWKDGGPWEQAKIPQEILDDIAELDRLKGAVRTVFNSDGSITEIFADGSYKSTEFAGDEIVEKTYKSDDTLLSQRTTVIGGNVITSKTTKGDA